MSSQTVTITKDQQKMLDASPKAWQQEAKRGLALCQSQSKMDVDSRHALGMIGLAMDADEKKYGTGGVVNLGLFLDVSENNLYNYIRFAATYTMAQVDALRARAAKHNFRLYWSHFDSLCEVEGPRTAAIRRELEAACIAEKLTGAELRGRWQNTKGGKNKNKKGRNPDKPKSILAGVGQMTKIYEQYANRWGGWTQAIFEEVNTAGPDRLTVTMLQELEEARDNQALLRDKASEAVRLYEEAIARVTRVLESADQAAAEAAEEGEFAEVPEDMDEEAVPEDLVPEAEAAEEEYEETPAPPPVRAVRRPAPVAKPRRQPVTA